MAIIPRDPHFDFTSVPKHWLNNDPYLTHMINASSPAFPYVESFVIHSVKNFLPQIQDETLRRDCELLIQQEATHARKHRAYNDMLKQQGYHFRTITHHLNKKLTYIKKHWTPRAQLALSVGFECFTTILSITILRHKLLESCDHTPSHFWHWHLSEELEHKNVLFDLYLHLNGSYFQRIAMLTLILFGYCYYSFRLFHGLLRTDGCSIWVAIRHLFGKNIFFISSILKTVKSYSIYFHPRTISLSN